MKSITATDCNWTNKEKILMTKTGLAFITAFCCAGCVVERAAEDGSATPDARVVRERPWLVINEDNDHYFNLDTSMMTSNALVAYADSICDGGKVTHFFMCPQGQRASFDSKAWQPIWADMLKPGADQRNHPAWPWNAKLLFDSGIDPYAVWIARCREKGVSPWLSMRMNDNHYLWIDDYFRTTDWYRANRDKIRVPGSKARAARWDHYALDFTWPEVRDYTFAMVEELLTRYDIDGLELDCLRNGTFFREDNEYEMAPVFTEFVRRCRKGADEAAKRLGHPVHLGIRCATRLGVARARGMDIVDIVRQGLVDTVVTCNAHGATDNLQDFASVEAELKTVNPKVRVIPGTDMFASCLPGKSAHHDAASLKGWVSLMQAQGAEDFYFFNTQYLPGAVRQAVCAGEVTKRGSAGPRRYVAGYHEQTAKGFPDEAQLPLPLANSAKVYVPVARGARAGRTLDVVLAADDPGWAAPEVSLNGDKPLKVSVDARLKRFGGVGWGNHLLPKQAYRFSFPAQSLKEGKNEVCLSASAGSKANLVWCEIELDATDINRQ